MFIINTLSCHILDKQFLLFNLPAELPNSELVRSWLESHVDAYNVRLALGACIVEEMRARILEETKFKSSAGVSHNKVFQNNIKMRLISGRKIKLFTDTCIYLFTNCISIECGVCFCIHRAHS